MDDGDSTLYAGSLNRKGEKEGFGIKSWPDGSIYVGMWKAGEADGKGWFFMESGDIYKGDWIKGR